MLHVGGNKLNSQIQELTMKLFFLKIISKQLKIKYCVSWTEKRSKNENENYIIYIPTKNNSFKVLPSRN